MSGIVHRVWCAVHPTRSTHTWSGHLEAWAAEVGYLVAATDWIGAPPPQVLADLPELSVSPLGTTVYCALVTIDADHIRRRGFARLHRHLQHSEPEVAAVWYEREQLDWRDRPPRAGLDEPGSRAEGWYRDPGGEHEQRWYSAGRPTSLVKDGAAEGSDPPLTAAS